MATDDHARERLYPRVVDRLLAERRQTRRPVRERIGDDILQIELRRLGIGRVLLAGAVGGVFGDAGLDRGNVGHARTELVAQRERGVDAGVDHAAAGIALGPEAALGQIEGAAEIVERLRLPFEPARKRAGEPAAAFDRRRVGGEAAPAELRRQDRVARALPHMQRLGHGAVIGIDARGHRHADAEHVADVRGRQLEQPGAGRRRADRADGAGGVPGAAAVVVGVGAAQPRSDLEADHERRQRLGRRRAGAFGERQQRRNDRRDQLALHIGEVEVERVRRNPVRQRRQLRRGAQDWPTIETAGLAPSARTSSSTMPAGSLRLPASITPTVSMNAVRARSTASAGACLRSKPAMKSTTRAVGLAPASLAFAACGACTACGACARAAPAAPSSVTALAARNSLRSTSWPCIGRSSRFLPPFRPSDELQKCMIGQLVQARNDHARLVEAAADSGAAHRIARQLRSARARRERGRAVREGQARENFGALRRRPDRLPRPLDQGLRAALSRRHRCAHRRPEQRPQSEDRATARGRAHGDGPRDLSDHPGLRQVEEGGRAAPVQARGLRHDRCGLQGRGRRLHRGQRQHRRLCLQHQPSCLRPRCRNPRSIFSSPGFGASSSPPIRPKTTPPFRCST